jgi:hypothetical protein
MSDSESNSHSSLQDWLAQQRALLKQIALATDAAQPQAWSKLMESYLRGLDGGRAEGQNNPAAQGSGFAPFAVGAELIQIWRNGLNAAGAARGAADSNFAELFTRLPGLGITREQTQAWRDLVAAQAECHALEQKLSQLLIQVQIEALDSIEEQLDQEAGVRDGVKSFRDLYNLWVDRAERIYSQLAHSDEFCKLQGDLGNATFRLRARQQQIAEFLLKQFDLPTRSELNSVHLQLKQMREKVAALESARTSSHPPKPTKVSSRAKNAKTRART